MNYIYRKRTKNYHTRHIPDGFRAGMLTYVGESEPFIVPSGQRHRAVLVKCDCGTIKRVRVLHFVRGRINSCGCQTPRHGDVGKNIHNIWRGMRTRTSEYGVDKHRYLDRGITVCEEWRDFTAFKTWAYANGYREGLQIDRTDNSKGYYPENCRFVDQVINVNNRDITVMVNYNGREVSLRLLLREFDKLSHIAAIKSRIDRGWSVERAVDTPIRKGNYKRKCG